MHRKHYCILYESVDGAKNNSTSKSLIFLYHYFIIVLIISEPPKLYGRTIQLSIQLLLCTTTGIHEAGSLQPTVQSQTTAPRCNKLDSLIKDWQHLITALKWQCVVWHSAIFHITFLSFYLGNHTNNINKTNLYWYFISFFSIREAFD